MPDVPFIPDSDTSRDAAEALRTRLLVGSTWIELAARPEGVNVREVERHLDKYDSGQSARQGELANRAEVIVKHPMLRRERCAVYLLGEGLTIEEAKARYRAWVASDKGTPRKREGLPQAVTQACYEAAETMRSTADEEQLSRAKDHLWETIRTNM